MMTLAQLLNSINTTIGRFGSVRLAAAAIKQAMLDIVNFFASQLADIIPAWAVDKTFQIDGTGDGKYCTYVDTDGNKRFFETKVANNTNNLPPSSPSITENTYWKEVSASASAALPEWAAGIYGPGLIIVYYDHPDDGKGLYLLTEGTRPFASTDIAAELVANKWERITRPHPIFKAISIAGTPITLDMRNLRECLFLAAANITVNKSWILSNAANAVQFKLRFKSNGALIVHTWPPEFKSSNAAWDPAAHAWTCYDAGEYEATATNDGTSWHLNIDGPYN